MAIYHLLRETPDNSGEFVETGDTMDTNESDARDRCRALSGEQGSRFGFWVEETVGA